MFLRRLQNCIVSVLALLSSGGVLLCVWGMGGTRFPSIEGERRFYLDSPSSQAKAKEALSLLDFARVRGESVSLQMTEVQALGLIEELGGEILFTERVDGVCSYYCYAEGLAGGLVLGEYFVNLHLAVEGSRCVVGSPIIFGGF